MGWNLIRFCEGISPYREAEPLYYYQIFNGKKWSFLGYNLKSIRKPLDVEWGAISLEDLEYESNKEYAYKNHLHEHRMVAEIKVFGGKKEVIEELKNFETLRNII